MGTLTPFPFGALDCLAPELRATHPNSLVMVTSLLDSGLLKDSRGEQIYSWLLGRPSSLDTCRGAMAGLPSSPACWLPTTTPDGPQWENWAHLS